MTIYERIRQLRISQGMSQFDLAKKVGYEGRSAISKVEAGDRDISQSMIQKYAEALNVSPTFLLYGEEERHKSQKTKKLTEFIDLFSQLTDEQQNLIIASMKGILLNGGTK